MVHLMPTAVIFREKGIYFPLVHPGVSVTGLCSRLGNGDEGVDRLDVYVYGVCTCVQIHVCICVCACMDWCMCVRTCVVCVHVFAHMCALCACVHTCVCLCVHVCMRTYVRVCVQAQAQGLDPWCCCEEQTRRWDVELFRPAHSRPRPLPGFTFTLTLGPWGEAYLATEWGISFSTY